VSGDRSSALRKRALRRLSHEHYPAYSALHEQVLSETPGLTRYQARGRAWTRLRYQFPDRYFELFALERGGIRTEVPPDPRGKQRACGRLADLRRMAYRSHFPEFRAQGMAPSKAYDRAVAAVREANAGLFTRLLAEEYQRWLAASGAGTPAGDRGPANGGGRAVTAAVASAAMRGAPCPALCRQGMTNERASTIKASALDYGGYGVTFAVSLLPPRMCWLPAPPWASCPRTGQGTAGGDTRAGTQAIRGSASP
jgi:hypothetical protein